MHKWEKFGQVFEISKHQQSPWMMEYCQAPNAIELDSCIRVFFSTRSSREDDGTYVSSIAYVDVDKGDPTKIISISKHPVLTPGPLGSFDEHGVYPLSVAQVDDQIMGLYGGWSRPTSVPFEVSIGLVSGPSADSLEKQGVGPVISKSLNQPYVCASPKLRFFDNTLHCFYIFGRDWIVDSRVEPLYSITSATSQDGKRWNLSDRPLLQNVLGPLEAQASPDVFFHDGLYHMYFSYRDALGFRNNIHRGYRLGYASSADLVSWWREDSFHDLAPSLSGWDSVSISYPNVITCETGVFMFYLGSEIGRWSFGVARLST